MHLLISLGFILALALLVVGLWRRWPRLRTAFRRTTYGVARGNSWASAVHSGPLDGIVMQAPTPVPLPTPPPLPSTITWATRIAYLFAFALFIISLLTYSGVTVPAAVTSAVQQWSATVPLLVSAVTAGFAGFFHSKAVTAHEAAFYSAIATVHAAQAPFA